jgi:hypothetical protein
LPRRRTYALVVGTHLASSIISAVIRRLKEAFECSVILHLDLQTDFGPSPTDKELGDTNTFEELKASTHDFPLELIERTVQLHASIVEA